MALKIDFEQLMAVLLRRSRILEHILRDMEGMVALPTFLPNYALYYAQIC